MTERTIPASVVASLNDQETSGFELLFLTITHRSLPEPLRVVSDPKPFVLGGNEYVGFLFNITLLSDDDRPPEAQLTIQNVDRRIARVLRDIVDPPQLKLEVIWSDQFTLTVDPRTEIGTASRIYVADHCFLTDVEVDAMQISGTIRSWDYTRELWPGRMATSDILPGLFR